MNSALQCLAHTKELADYFLSASFVGHCLALRWIERDNYAFRSWGVSGRVEP